MTTCADCDRYWRPVELGEGGACPTCERLLDTTPAKTPWHFKLLVAATVLYLGWRLVEGLIWVAEQL